ncbi:winged helix-turn-helix transcriptional regulator [Fodinicola feengrottensis]|uniref:winged helix-turn-helix transcriptional regulator n=1 Tax=Fodinicola feengrottensis TaxID=435914 RepID=UPI0036F44B07
MCWLVSPASTTLRTTWASPARCWPPGWPGWSPNRCLVRERYQEHPPREHYLPTEKGKDLYPVLLALMNWGDRWYAGQDGPPAVIRHLGCAHVTTPVTGCGHCGEPLTLDNTTQLPGPGGRSGPGTRMLGQLMTSRRSDN